MSIANNYYSKEKVLFALIGLHYRVNRKERFYSYVWLTDQSDKCVVYI